MQIEQRFHQHIKSYTVFRIAFVGAFHGDSFHFRCAAPMIRNPFWLLLKARIVQAENGCHIYYQVRKNTVCLVVLSILLCLFFVSGFIGLLLAIAGQTPWLELFQVGIPALVIVFILLIYPQMVGE